MQVYRLPVLSDNYIFLLHDPDRRTAAVVDPAQAEPVLQQLDLARSRINSNFQYAPPQRPRRRQPATDRSLSPT